MRLGKNDKTTARFDHEAAGFFLARSPLFPFEKFSAWTDSAANVPDELAREILRAQLAEVFRSSVAMEALFVASPSLHQRTIEWLDEFTKTAASKEVKLESSLVRYFTRMCFRPTPFGLFAGMTVGGIGDNTNLCLESAPFYRRRARLDSAYVFDLADRASRDPEIRALIRYVPNPSIYEKRGRLRFVEGHWEKERRKYQLSEVPKTGYLTFILENAKHRKTLSELVALLARLEDVEESEAEAFLDSMIEAKLLLPETEPPVTGVEPFQFLVDCLKKLRAPL